MLLSWLVGSDFTDKQHQIVRFAHLQDASPGPVHSQLAICPVDKSPPEFRKETPPGPFSLKPTGELSSGAAGKGTRGVVACDEAAERRRRRLTKSSLAPLLKNFNSGRKFEVTVDGRRETRWSCALCLTNQDNPKQQFSHHCQTKGHRQRLEIAAEMVEAQGEVRSAEEFVRELPSKVGSVLRRSEKGDAARKQEPEGWNRR